MNKLEHKLKSISDEFDEELRHQDAVCVNESQKPETIFELLKYLLMGVFLGILFIKAEIISWFRIQEMFRFQSFHMYGIIGSAVIVGVISVFFIKKYNIKTLHGEKIILAEKKFNKGQIYGGLAFGIGWAITGACPGPLYAQIGAGFGAIVLTLLSAIAGTWFYGLVRNKLPH
jgi:uncharacterized protein